MDLRNKRGSGVLVLALGPDSYRDWLLALIEEEEVIEVNEVTEVKREYGNGGVEELEEE